MMLRALFKKKIQEFRASHSEGLLVVLFVFSLLPLFSVFFDTPLALFASTFPLVMVGCFLGPICAVTAFQGEFANQANRFLECLPLRRSAIWLAGYLSGLAMLCLAVVSLFWLAAVLFPVVSSANTGSEWQDADVHLFFSYLVPSRVALAVSCSSILFWTFSVTVFPAAYLETIDGKQNGVGALFFFGPLLLPIAMMVFLGQLGIMPSGLGLSPVLLASGLLFSAGSFALFALVPKHITRTKHVLLGLGLFLAIFGTLLGQLYAKHLAWRVLDASQPLEIEDVYPAHLEGEPNLLVAEVRSYRSSKHCVSIDVEKGTYHDLGRKMELLEVPDNDSGLLHFLHCPYGVFRFDVYGFDYFASLTPDGARKRSFKIRCDRSVDKDSVRWLPDRELLVYPAYDRLTERSYLRVADSNGASVKKFEINSRSFLMNAAGQALVLAPVETTDDEAPANEEPYMIIDLDSGPIHRFGLPGRVVCFSKDLTRVICSRTRVEGGRQYMSYFIVELPSLKERPLLSEDEFPPQEVTTQVDPTVHANIAKVDNDPRSYLRINDAFDKALRVKQRVDGDHFRYSIVLLDLDTGQQRTLVPESATPETPIVITKGLRGDPITVNRFTADEAGFIYTVGQEVYLCEIEDPQPILLADNSIPLEGAEEELETLNDAPREKYPTVYSPSGRRVLRYANIYQPFIPNRGRRLKFSAVEIFEGGKPVRLHTGSRTIMGATWLDDQRIVFHDDEAIHLLESTGGPARQIFPPVASAGSD